MFRAPRAWLAAALGGLVCLCAGAAPAGEPAVPPARQRLLCRFDFEERVQGNFEDLPRHWQRMGRAPVSTDKEALKAFLRVPLHAELVNRPGFPAYAEVRFDQSQHVSGEYSFYLGLDGHNVGAFLEAGTLRATPGGDYQITALVRTTPLRHARARLLAYLIDAAGRRIEDSTASSSDLATDQRWQPVAVRLTGDHPAAAWIGLQIEVTQPEPQPGAALGQFQVQYEDVRGGAWFDDIAIWQVPRVGLRTQSRTNLIRAPDAPELHAAVHDLAGTALTAEITVRDIAGREAARTQRTLAAQDAGDWTWTPALPRYGWYRADLAVRAATSGDGAGGAGASPHAPVARATTMFLLLPAEPPLAPVEAARFQLEAEGVAEEQLAQLPEVMERTGLGAVVLSAWQRTTTPATLEQQQSQLDALVQALMARGRQVTLSLNPLPSELATALDLGPHDALEMFRTPRDPWLPYLMPVLMRHGEHVKRWQLGTPGHADALFVRDLPTLLTGVERQFRELAPQPQLVLPWRLDQARRADVRGHVAFAMSVPPAVRPEYLGAYLTEWNAPVDRAAGAGGAPKAELSLSLSSLPAEQLAQPARVDDLVLRLLYAWEAGAGQLSLPQPWVESGDHAAGAWPDPLLGAFSETARRLASRRVVGRLALGPGLECLILSAAGGEPSRASGDSAGAGTLVAWNRSAPEAQALLNLYLGPQPVAVDVWGNRTAVPLVDGRHRLALSRTPVFIEGVDPALAQFRAAFTIEPGFIESTQAAHACTITLVNPWPRTLSGTMLLTEPRSWRVEPRRSNFSIAAGQTLKVPVEISFPVSEVAGRKRVTARFELAGERREVIELSTPLEVGLRDLAFDATLALEQHGEAGSAAVAGTPGTPGSSGGADAVATLLITNTSDRPLALYAFATLPGFPRQERLVPRLLPGQSAVRRFRFPDAGEALRRSDLRVGLREAAGPAMLNKVLSLAEK